MAEQVEKKITIEPTYLLRSFLSGPYTGAEVHQTYENVQQARKLLSYLLPQGIRVFCPQVHYAFMDGLLPYTVFLDMCFQEIADSDVMFLMSTWATSKGAQAERVFALENHTSIIYLPARLDTFNLAAHLYSLGLIDNQGKQIPRRSRMKG